MDCTINGCTIELVQGDITNEQVDAIANAANRALAGGGGVDGAIHRRGGPDILRETDERYPDGCPTGSAVISGAGRLPMRHIIHAVGPVYRGGNSGEAELLASAYRRSLELAVAHDCQSIAFPALSTGAYCYPLEEASRVSLSAVIEFLDQNGKPPLVRFVLFDAPAYTQFRQMLVELAAVRKQSG
jgi:O-acetyl-ADP-ribose deacetylase (regulator of RNase III)